MVNCLWYISVPHLGIHLRYNLYGHITIYGIPHLVPYMRYNVVPQLASHVWYTGNGDVSKFSIPHMVINQIRYIAYGVIAIYGI